MSTSTKLLMPVYSRSKQLWRYIICLTAILLGSGATWAQSLLPNEMTPRTRYNVAIKIKEAQISGLCIMHLEGDTLRASVFNEFGVSLIDFIYLQKRKKVQLKHLPKMINKWYIRCQLRKDLRALIHALGEGETSYTNSRHSLSYRFSPAQEPVSDEAPQ